MREFKATASQIEAIIDPVNAATRRLHLKREVVMTMLLIHSINGRTSTGSAHCF